VFCDLDQHAGRRRSSGTTHSLPSPRPLRDWPRHGSRRRRADTATAVAGLFRQPDTGESPSRIDSSSIVPVPGQTRMVHLPATAAIEYVAAGPFFPGGLWPGGLLAGGFLSGGAFVRGVFCPGGLFPWGSFSRGHFWPGGFLSGVLLSGGSFARGDFCPGGLLCPFPQVQCVYAPSRLSVPSIVA